jgi:hypothetical protein
MAWASLRTGTGTVAPARPFTTPGKLRSSHHQRLPVATLNAQGPGDPTASGKFLTRGQNAATTALQDQTAGSQRGGDGYRTASAAINSVYRIGAPGGGIAPGASADPGARLNSSRLSWSATLSLA